LIIDHMRQDFQERFYTSLCFGQRFWASGKQIDIIRLF